MRLEDSSQDEGTVTSSKAIEDKLKYKLRKELDKWDRVELDLENGTKADFMAIDFILDKLTPVIQAIITTETTRLGALAASEKAKQRKDSKSLPWSWRGEEQPSYVLQRKPFSETHSVYEMWVKHEDFKISPVKLGLLLSEVLKNQVKRTDMVATDLGQTEATQSRPGVQKEQK